MAGAALRGPSRRCAVMISGGIQEGTVDSGDEPVGVLTHVPKSRGGGRGGGDQYNANQPWYLPIFRPCACERIIYNMHGKVLVAEHMAVRVRTAWYLPTYLEDPSKHHRTWVLGVFTVHTSSCGELFIA